MMNEGEMCGAVVPWYERSGVDGCDDGRCNHREVRLAQLETQAVIHPVRIRHRRNHLKHIIAQRGGQNTMSTLAKLAKEIDETRDIGQTTAECRLAVQPSKKSWLHAEMRSHRAGWSRSHRGAYHVVAHRDVRERRSHFRGERT